MPYTISKFKSGFRLCKNAEPKRCFSKKPLTMKQAEKQRTAIVLRKMGIPKKQKGKGSVVLLGSYNGTPYAPISK